MAGKPGRGGQPGRSGRPPGGTNPAGPGRAPRVAELAYRLQQATARPVAIDPAHMDDSALAIATAATRAALRDLEREALRRQTA